MTKPTLREHVRLHDRRRRTLHAAAPELLDLLGMAIQCAEAHPEASCAGPHRCAWMIRALQILAQLEAKP